ncbi:MAG: single-stranded-DNA-specific exonuclease RecJ [Pseudomonadota bacterium]
MTAPAVILTRQPEGEPVPLAADAQPQALEPRTPAQRLDEIYRARACEPEAARALDLTALLRPADLPDIDRAAARLAQAVVDAQRILIVGDFDADGATSVALAMRVLRGFGAKDPAFLVPNRFEFGYGLSPEIVELAARQSPDLIVTVDNGVASVEGVARANALGIDVIVTDHHLPGAVAPAAYAIVNPVLPDSRFGSRALAGVGVIYYVLGATRAALQEQGWFAERPAVNLARYLDLVALGTVADVVPLDHNNRILVAQGLRRMRAGACCEGLKAMLEFAGRERAALSAADLGFALGPRLNAAGRLDDMTIGIRCLLADEPNEARRLAKALNELNQVRRELEAEMVAEAELHAAQALQQALEALPTAAAGDLPASEPRGIAVFDPLWHQGVVGLVAGRLKDRLARPVIAFAQAGDAAPGELKGSARSVAGVHIRDLLDGIATRYPGLIRKFGGHAMAAGLSIAEIHFKQFSKIFADAVANELPASALMRSFETDGALPTAELTVALARALAAGGPWGQQFPEPSFHGDFAVVSQRVVGDGHLKLTLQRDNALFDAIAFRTPPVTHERVRAVYRLEENRYRVRDPKAAGTVQLVIEHLAGLPA